MKIDLWKVLLFFGLILTVAYKIYPNHLEMATLFEKSNMYYMALQEVESALDKRVDVPGLNQAAKLYETVGDPDQSIHYYTEIIAREPENLDAHINLVRLYQWVRRPDHAVEEYERFLGKIGVDTVLQPELSRYRGEIMENLRDIYSYRGNYAKLIDITNRMIELGMQTEQRSIDVIDLYTRKRDAKNALQACYDAVERYPDSHKVIEKAAWVSYLTGDYDFSKSLYYQLVAQYPNEKHYWFDLITVLKKANDTGRLVDIYADLAALFPGDHEILLALASEYMESKLYAKGIEIYSMLHEKEPGNLMIIQALADAYEQKEDYQTALDLMLTLEKHNPSDPILQQRIITVYVQLKDFQEAQERAQKLLAQHPDDTRVILQLANLYEWNSQPVPAAQMVEQLHVRNPDDMQLVKRLAALYQWSEQFDKAIPYLEQLVTATPDSIRYNRELFGAYMSVRDTQNALALGKRLLSIDPDNEYYLRQMAYLYMETGETAKAYEALLRYTRHHQADEEMLANLAWLAEATGDKHAAIGYLEKSIARGSPSEQQVAELARLYAETGSSHQAYDLIQTYKDSFADNIPIQILLADLYIDRKNYDNALNILTDLSDAADKKQIIEIERRIADIYLAQNEYRTALTYLANLHQLDADNPVFIEQLAYAYSSLEQPQQALFYFNKLIGHKPNDVQAHYMAGMLSYQINDRFHSRMYLYRALSLLNRSKPDNPDALMYARIYQTLQKNEHAMFWFNRALDTSPDNAEVLGSYLGFLLGLEQYQQMIRIVSASGTQAQQDPVVQYHLAYAYANTNQYDAAIRIMRNLIEQYPDNGDYRADLGFIFQKQGRWDHSLKLYDDLLKSQPPSWARYKDIEEERDSIKAQYAPKLTAGVLLIDEIKKDTQMYYSQFQMYLMHNLLVKTGMARYYFHDATLPNFPNIDDDLTEVNLEIDYFFAKHWSLAIGPLVINHGTKDIYSFTMGLLYNNFDDLSVSVKYSFRDKIIDPRAAVPLGGTSDHVDLRLEWQATPYLKFLAEATHGEYHFSPAVRRLSLSTTPGYYNQFVAGADLTLLKDPNLALTYRYYWSDAHFDRAYEPLFNIDSKTRSHQFGIRYEQQITENIFVYGTGFVGNDAERDMFVSHMGQYGVEGGMRLNISENIEIGGSYSFIYEKGINAQAGRASYINAYGSIAF